jgi:selT/selW/selH-like putative selenoprotein
VRDFISARIDCDIDLIAGSGGVFEITANETLHFSKKSTGRFPNDAELQSLIDAIRS